MLEHRTSNSKRSWLSSWHSSLPLAIVILLVWVYAGVAQEQNPLAVTPADPQVVLDTLWVMLTGALVFFMNAGFAMLETGFCQRANAINILAKNLIVFAVVTAAFSIFGYSIMFGEGNEYFGWNGFFLFGFTEEKLPLKAHFFFQLTFASTAATIVSGAVAERIRFLGFILFSFWFVLIYALVGHWAWGPEGWLYELGFRDFAGSTVVHSVGGWAALVGAIVLGPRQRKYEKVPQQTRLQQTIRPLIEKSFRGKKINPIPGHNLSFSSLGCFILWLGWFGFNGGSTLAAEPHAIAHIIVTTFIAGACGALFAIFSAWLLYKKPSISFLINGILGGCVSITASCAFVNILSAVFIGLVAGLLVFFVTIVLDWLHIDDPVGAVPVHLGCGIWGTLAVGLFSQSEIYEAWNIPNLATPETSGFLFDGGVTQFIDQCIGIAVVGFLTLLLSSILWFIFSFVGYLIYDSRVNSFNIRRGLRVTPQEEKLGLDRLFAEGDDFRLRLAAPKLSKFLKAASSEKLRNAALEACSFAIERTSWEEPILQQGLDALRAGNNYRQTQLRVEIEILAKQLVEQQWNLQAELEDEKIERSEYEDAFKQARVANSVYLALDADAFVAASGAINEAYAATNDLKTLQERVLNNDLG